MLCRQKLLRGNHGAELLHQGLQALFLFLQDFKQLRGNVLLFAVGLDLHVHPGQDVVQVKGELACIQIPGIVFFDEFLEELLEIFVPGQVADRRVDGFYFTVHPPLQPAQPRSYIPFFAEQLFGLAAPGLVGQKVVQAGHDRRMLRGDIGVVEEIELSLHVAAQGSGDKGGVGPGGPLDTGGAHFRGRGRGYNARPDGDTLVRGLGHPDRRHGVTVAATIGDYPCFDPPGVFALVRVIGQGAGRNGAAGVGVGNGYWFAVVIRHAFFPQSLEIKTLGRRIFSVAGPVGFAAIINENIGPDHLSSRFP